MRTKDPTAATLGKSAEALKKTTAALASAISKPESHTEVTAVAAQAHT